MISNQQLLVALAAMAVVFAVLWLLTDLAFARMDRATKTSSSHDKDVSP